MDIIHLLPDSVANQIAAGEVIQRPASCLKELVENSLDAGATRIQVVVRDAGRTLLQVVDNGKGMSETDARMAFERHATSKIREAADLFALRTMGFRGEALASICAVAQVEVTTRREEDEMGTRLEIAGSEVLYQEPCQCPVGTNIRVKNLFYNVPVRRKFLKTDQTELRNLLTDFHRIVLVYPQVQFTFVHNDEILSELPVGTEKQRIESVFGKGTGRQYTANLVEIHTDTDLVSIHGFVAKPESTGKNAQQYFFVNGRYMRHPYFQKAVMTAYSGMLPGDYQPSFFIYFDINPQSIDVNIHPTKTEIKFADEQAIFQILLASVREALGKFSLAPTIDFNREGEIDMPLPDGSCPTAAPQRLIDPNYNPFRVDKGVRMKDDRLVRSDDTLHRPFGTDKPYGNHLIAGWEQLYQTEQRTQNQESRLGSLAPEISETGAGDLCSLFLDACSNSSPLWQYGGKYILMAMEQGIAIINQHRAHACVLYHLYMEQLSEAKGATQKLLFPDVLELTTEDMPLIAPMVEELRHIGFDLEQLGKTAYSIYGLPAQLGQQNGVTALRHILDAVRDTGANVRAEWRKQIAMALANDTAIPYGKTLTEEEMRDLVKNLFALPSYLYTPDGKRVIKILTDEDLRV
ncbi:MAG: DNA mismatch repair endonuclease MutL [Paludibacteraceae bacterium]